ncbi:MAG: hypothetical protein JSW51_03565 [Gemmatimonadota bacterium]|nr:MAG: hypothetical protein JSW51_03565 [Gemmatimonadota bacterium]
MAVALAAIVTLAAQLEAQRPLAPVGTQDLTFGIVIPGLPTAVSRLDAANSGQYEIRGERLTEVRVDLTLPATLDSPSGAAMPLQFGAGDGGFADRPAIRSSQVFDPRAPLITGLSASGRLYIWLGGTVLPVPTQEQGDYAATIVLTVSYTGV